MFREFIDNIEYVFDKLKVTRRISVFFTLWLTYYTVIAMIDLAGKIDAASLEVAAIIGALTAPVTALQGFILKFHHQGHKDANNPDHS